MLAQSHGYPIDGTQWLQSQSLLYAHTIAWPAASSSPSCLTQALSCLSLTHILYLMFSRRGQIILLLAFSCWWVGYIVQNCCNIEPSPDHNATIPSTFIYLFVGYYVTFPLSSTLCKSCICSFPPQCFYIH